MKLPKVDLEEIEKFKEKNFKNRLDFIDKYVDWLKKKTNGVLNIKILLNEKT